MIDRRKLLQLVAAGLLSETLVGQQATPGDPQFFSSDEFALLDRLTEIILPADEKSGGAREAEIAAFVDLVVRHSQAAEQTAWRAGVEAVDAAARAAHGKPFVELTGAEADGVVAKAASEEDSPTTPLGSFFPRVKRLTLMGYYASPVGLHRELEYQGNQPLAEFPACDHPEHGATA